MEDIVDIVDENDRFVRKATRTEAKGKILLHRLARVAILNKDGKLLIQKRAKSKELWPGCWDIGLTETVDGELKLQPEEVEDAMFLMTEEIQRFMRKEPFTPRGTVTFNTYLQHKAQQK